jgi:hypothetical protein
MKDAHAATATVTVHIRANRFVMQLRWMPLVIYRQPLRTLIVHAGLRLPGRAAP